MEKLKKTYSIGKKIYDRLLSVFLGGKYRKNLKLYKLDNRNNNFNYQKKYKNPQILDRYMSAGNMDQYFWQDLWAAQLIAKNNPKNHFDIGSRIDGFIAHLASFRGNINLIDIRPLDKKIPNVDFHQDDATNLKNIESCSIESLSALCSLEHFGLGRYGDPIDPDACFKAFKSIQRVMKKGGDIYIAVPIGKEHLEFDAHRVFYASTIISNFNEMELVEFSVINPDCTGIEYNVDINKYDNDAEKGGFRFGLFNLRKK